MLAIKKNGEDYLLKIVFKIAYNNKNDHEGGAGAKRVRTLEQNLFCVLIIR